MEKVSLPIKKNKNCRLVDEKSKMQKFLENRQLIK